MFLPAVSAKSHTVFLGKAGMPLQKFTQLSGEGKENIAHLSSTSLDAEAAYIWRVDTHTNAGTVETGDLWTFSTGTEMACHITPKPPQPPGPTPGTCTNC